MKKIVKLTEKDIEKIIFKVIKEQENNENIIDSIKNSYQGLKGVWRGEGYDYYKYLSSIGGLTRKLKKLDIPNVKIISQLKDLKNKINSSKMPQDKKNRLMNAIDLAENHFNAYTNAINTIENTITQKLN